MTELGFRKKSAKLIRSIRKRKGQEVTQMELKEIMGISQATLSKIENEVTTVSVVPWLKFCRHFGVKPSLEGVA